MIRRAFGFFLNLVGGSVFLTLVFHYVLSLPIRKSIITALILSLVLDTEYILNKKVLRKKVAKQESIGFSKLTRGDKVILAMLSLVCLIYGTLGIHHVLVLPLLSSFLIATILTVLVDFAYVTYVKRRKPKEKKVYSIKQFLFESFFVLLIFVPTYLSSVDLKRSLAIALYVYILIHWYYNFSIPKYVFTRAFIVFRVVLVFFIMFYGWFTLVKGNPIISAIVAVLTSLACELCRRASTMLVKIMSEKDINEATRSAGAIFQPIGFLYGMLVGVMAAEKIYGSWYFAWWSLELYRLAYVFTLMFFVPFSLIYWIGAKAKLRRAGIKGGE